MGLLNVDPATRSQRRAAPSPLQTSITANSSYSTPTPTRTFAKASLDSRSRITEARRNDPLLNGDSPRSPKERLDDLLASERTFYNPDDDPLDKVANGILPRHVDAFHQMEAIAS